MTFTKLTSDAVTMLRQYSGGSATTSDIARPLAEIMVAARQQFRTNDGEIDWDGRSAEYRDWLHDVFLQAGIQDATARNRIQSAARYHVTEYRTKALLSKGVSSPNGTLNDTDFVSSAAERKRQLREQEQDRTELLAGRRQPRNAGEARLVLAAAGELVDQLIAYLGTEDARTKGLAPAAVDYAVRLSESVPLLAEKVAEVVESAVERRRRREDESLERLRKLSR